MVPSIASAVAVLEDLKVTLDQAYWEVSSTNPKDAIYDCISSINNELAELNKLSILDHDLPYEPVSHEFKGMTRRISLFRKYLDTYVIRATTLDSLDHALSATVQLIAQKPPQE